MNIVVSEGKNQFGRSKFKNINQKTIDKIYKQLTDGWDVNALLKEVNKPIFFYF